MRTNQTTMPGQRPSEAIRRLARRSRILVTAAAVSGVLAACGGSGAPLDGMLCAECGDNDTPCVATETLEVPGAHYDDLCGGKSTDECPYCTTTDEGVSCTVGLTCTHEYNSPARRCYPNKPGSGSTTVDPEFKCKGVPPKTS